MTLTLAPGMASAQPGLEDQAGFDSTVKIYMTNAQPAAFLDAVKDRLPPDAHSLLKMQLAGFGKESLPKLRVLRPGSFQLDSGGKMIFAKIISHRPPVITVNGHKIDFTDGKSYADLWNRIAGTLPGQRQAFKSSILVPAAYGDDNPMRTTGGAAFTGGVAVLALANGWHPVGWGLVALAAATWNAGVCNDFKKDAVRCSQDRTELESLVDKQAGRKEALDAKRPRPACPRRGEPNVVDPKDARDLVTSLNVVFNNSEEFIRKVSYCSGDFKSRLASCVRHAAHLAHYLCIDMFGLTDGYLEPWANVRTMPGQNHEPRSTK